MRRYLPTRLSPFLSVLFFISGVSLYAYGASDVMVMSRFYVHHAYKILFLISLAAIVFLAQGNFKRVFLKEAKYPLTSALILSVLVAVFLPGRFRVINDETNLVAVAQTMAHDGSVGVPFEIRRGRANYSVVTGGVPKRPILFSFGAHFLNLISGIRHQNLFYFNSFVLFCSLCLIGLIGLYFGSILESVALQAMLISQPVVLMGASSAGFELFSAAFVVLFMLATGFYLESPNAYRLRLLWIIGILTAHTRYECIAYVSVVFLALLVRKKITREQWKENWGWFCLTPLFLFPLVWPRIHYGDVVYHAGPPQAQSWRVFSLNNLIKNGLSLFSNSFSRNESLPYNFILPAVAVCFGFLLLFLKFRKKLNLKSSVAKDFTVLCALVTITYLAIILSHNAGNYLRPTGFRYFILLSFVFALVSFLFFRLIPSKHAPKFYLAFALANVAWQAPRLSHFDIQNEAKLLNYLLEELKPLDPKLTLVISEQSTNFAATGFAALAISTVRDQERQLLETIRVDGYRDIFVLQFFNREKNAFLADSYWKPLMGKLEVVASYPYSPELLAVTSRLVWNDLK